MRLIDADRLIETIRKAKDSYPASSELEKMIHDAECDFAIEWIADEAEHNEIKN